MIRINKIIAKDCFAYTLLDFDFISGIHSIEGINGSAKTSIFMTLMQGFFNRNAKGARIEEVNNTITGLPYEIEIHFSKDGESEYVVINSRKSGTIEIYKDGKPKHVKRIPDNLKIIESILGVDYNMFQDLIYQSPKSSINLLEKDSDSSRKAFLNNILALDDIDSSLEKFKARDKELSGKNGQIELLRQQIQKTEGSIVEDYDNEQAEIDVTATEALLESLMSSKDTLQLSLAKEKAQLTILKVDLEQCNTLKETLERIAETEKYISTVVNIGPSLPELLEQKNKVSLEKQDIIRQVEEVKSAQDILQINADIEAKKAAIFQSMSNLVQPDSDIDDLERMLGDAKSRSTATETNLSINQQNLTELLECVKISICPTCKQSMDVDSIQEKVNKLKSSIEVYVNELTTLKHTIELLEEAIVSDKLYSKYQHSLEVLSASVKECKYTEEDLEKILAEIEDRKDRYALERERVQRSIASRETYDEAVQELSKLKEVRGTQLDRGAIESKVKKHTDAIKALQYDLEDCLGEISEQQRLLKSYQEFNTIQRTIKAVNNQKRTYNDSAKANLEALYKDLGAKEDAANLVKIWLNVLGPKGFRVHKMNTFLSHLNSAMRKYSEMLSDGKIRCMFFMTEGEIDFTVTDCNKTIAWSCWSEGEKARVKMACLFAVLELLEVMGAVSFNVLALDEIFSALDHAGKEGLFKVLNYLKDRGRAIFTISHTPLALDTEYDSVIKACKQDDGTTTITQ